MNLPVLNGTIDRRILINYRVKPEVVKALLPPHLEPLVVNGYASAGICLLRLKNIGLKYSPSFLRITSENVAHRFLVKWKTNGEDHFGVYIPRRDTDSILNVVLAGKFFAWPHYLADFSTEESGNDYNIRVKSRDPNGSLFVSAHRTNTFPENSMFDSMEHASLCFQRSTFGISPAAVSDAFKVMELKTKSWTVSPISVDVLASNYFENKNLFPVGSIAFDNALFMEGIEHEWVSS